MAPLARSGALLLQGLVAWMRGDGGWETRGEQLIGNWETGGVIEVSMCVVFPSCSSLLGVPVVHNPRASVGNMGWKAPGLERSKKGGGHNIVPAAKEKPTWVTTSHLHETGGGDMSLVRGQKYHPTWGRHQHQWRRDREVESPNPRTGLAGNHNHAPPSAGNSSPGGVSRLPTGRSEVPPPAR